MFTNIFAHVVNRAGRLFLSSFLAFGPTTIGAAFAYNLEVRVLTDMLSVIRQKLVLLKLVGHALSHLTAILVV